MDTLTPEMLTNIRTELIEENLLTESIDARFDKDLIYLSAGNGATGDMLGFWKDELARLTTAKTIGGMFDAFSADRKNGHLLIQIMRRAALALQGSRQLTASEWRYTTDLRCPVCDDWIIGTDLRVLSFVDSPFVSLDEEADPEGGVDYNMDGVMPILEPVLLHYAPGMLRRKVQPCLIHAGSIDWDVSED